MFKHSIHYFLYLDDQAVFIKEYDFQASGGTKMVNVKGLDIATHFAVQSELSISCTIFLPLIDNNVEQKYLDVIIKGRTIRGRIVSYSETPGAGNSYLEFYGLLDAISLINIEGDYASYKLEIKINKIIQN